MAKNDQSIPKAVFHMLKAAKFAIESLEMSCLRTGDCSSFCVYHIVRSGGREECLYDMICDAMESEVSE